MTSPHMETKQRGICHCEDKNSSPAFKIAVIGKEEDEARGNIKVLLSVCICGGHECFEWCSIRSRRNIAQASLTYLLLSARVKHTAQGEKKETFFNANDIAQGRTQPKVEASWIQISLSHLLQFPSAPSLGQCWLPLSYRFAPWSPLRAALLYDCARVLTILMISLP